MRLDPMHELKWAYRNLRARGPRAVVSAVLIAVAIAANVLVFAVSDSLVFRPLPYSSPERLVAIGRAAPRGLATPFLSPRVLDEWRRHEDLFTSVHGYLTQKSHARRNARQAASRWIESQLFGVDAMDPSITVLTLAGTLVAATLAAWPAAVRATRIEPVVALRAP